MSEVFGVAVLIKLGHNLGIAGFGAGAFGGGRVAGCGAGLLWFFVGS